MDTYRLGKEDKLLAPTDQSFQSPIFPKEPSLAMPDLGDLAAKHSLKDQLELHNRRQVQQARNVAEFKKYASR